MRQPDQAVPVRIVVVKGCVRKVIHDAIKNFRNLQEAFRDKTRKAF